MADEDLFTNLANYKLQLQQVDAALTSDTGNEDLLKLKKDLQEVINLTADLVNTKAEEEPSSDSLFEEASTSVNSTSVDTPNSSVHEWKHGDMCMAPYSKDSQYYMAEIDDITADGDCTVTFCEYGNTDVTRLSLLKPVMHDVTQTNSKAEKPSSKKEIIAAQREYKRKKAQKKIQRLKAIEEEREKEKGRWQEFNAKAFAKTKKGRVKKSIFATPENPGGRVGIGTCGVSGKPMTKFAIHEKYKK